MSEDSVSEEKDMKEDEEFQSSTPKKPRQEEVPVPSTSNTKDSHTVPMSSKGSSSTNNSISDSRDVTAIGSINANTVHITTSSQNDLARLSADSIATIKEESEDMLETTAVDMIMDKIEGGPKWINIIGGPGDGKTTAAYLALKRCFSKGKDVFVIQKSEDYKIVKQEMKIIILFNDIFGTFYFEYANFDKWKDVMEDLLKLKERRNPEREVTVLSVHRECILKEVAKHLGKYKRLVCQSNYEVDVGSLNNSVEEKGKLWKFYRDKYDISLNEADEAIKDSAPHGFPSYCKIFADNYLERNPDINISFFSRPLLFINEEMERLLELGQIECFLKELLKGNGSVAIGSEDKTSKSSPYYDAMSLLKPTYLAVKNGIASFKHNSFYDSAASCLLQKDPRFIIEKCNMTFLSKVAFSVNRKEHISEFSIDESYLGEFVKRCLSEIEALNILPVLSHSECANQYFGQSLLEGLTLGNKEVLRDVIHRKDKTSGKSFLFLSTLSGSLTLLQYICRHLNLSHDDQSEAIFGICLHDAEDALKFFLDTYPDFNMDSINGEGQTPEMVLAAAGSDRCMSLLSQKDKLTVSKKDKNGMTTLHPFCVNGGNKCLVEDLILKGANVNEKCSSGMSPLHYASKYGYAEIALKLLEWGADSEMESFFVSPPLTLASLHGNAGVISVLLDQGVTNTYEPYTSPLLKSPIHLACSSGHALAVKTLLQRCTLPDKRKLTSTLMDTACRSGDTNMVKTLIECKTDVNEMFLGHSHPQESVHERYIENEDVIKTTPPLHIAYSFGHIDVIKLLICHGADVNRKASDGCAFFSNVFKNHEESIILYLIEKRLDANLCDRLGTSILHKACCSGFKTAVKHLLRNGAEVNKPNMRGLISIHAACGPFREVGDDSMTQNEDNRLMIIRNICEVGDVQINWRDNDGNTALHRACEQNLVHVAGYLLEKHADQTLRNMSNDSPLALLCKGCRESKTIYQLAVNMIKEGGNADDLSDWCRSEYLRKQALLKHQAIKQVQ